MLPYPWSVRAKVAVALVNAMPYFVLGDFYDTVMYAGDPMHMGIDHQVVPSDPDSAKQLVLCWPCAGSACGMLMPLSWHSQDRQQPSSTRTSRGNQ